MIDPSQHAKNRGSVESLLRNIPGFKGYLEKEYRRESDLLVRTHMADRLQRSKRSIDDYSLKLVSAGQLDATTAAEQLRTRVDRLINRLRAAPRGYSGFFDFVQKNEHSLEKIYEHDLTAVADAENLAATIEKLPQANGPATESLGEALKLVDALDQKINQREDLLKGVAGNS